MTVMVAEVYDALKEAGASEEKARKAVEVLAGFEGRFSAIETRLAVLMVMVGGLYAILLPGGILSGVVSLFSKSRGAAAPS